MPQHHSKPSSSVHFTEYGRCRRLEKYRCVSERCVRVRRMSRRHSNRNTGYTKKEWIDASAEREALKNTCEQERAHIRCRRSTHRRLALAGGRCITLIQYEATHSCEQCVVLCQKGRCNSICHWTSENNLHLFGVLPSVVIGCHHVDRVSFL